MQTQLLSHSIGNAASAPMEYCEASPVGIVHFRARDFSIVGFNDIPTAKYMLPPLTTMRLYMDFMGEKAVDIIGERIQNKREIPMQIILPAKLMIRESVRTISEEISICATT